jgi:hypothetical protein
MKIIGYLLLAAAATTSTFAQAPTSTRAGSNLTPYVPPPIPYTGGGYGYGWWSRSSTAAEGYGRGLAEVIRAKGDYNLATSAAAVNFSEARRREIENDKAWTQTYFEMREVNRQQRDAEIKRQRGNPADFARYAQAGKPKPLSNRELDAVTGEIHWPILLTAANYEPQRAALAKIFAARAYHGVLKSEDFLSAVRTIDDISAGLTARINEVPPQQFVEARRFLRSLAYEARMPAG